MAIKTDTFSSAGGGAGTDTLDDVTGRGATTTNAVTVGGVTIGTEYSLPTADGTDGQVVVTNGTGTLSFTTLDFTGGLEYKGSFNATAGTPSLLNAEKGDFYIIDTAGTIYGQTWAVGDHLLINEDMGGTITNSKIDKIDNTQAVTSVNTQTGAVVLSGNDLTADHTAVNYTAANANIDGHLSGIDSALGASATPTLDGVTTNGNTTTNAINVGTITTSGDILADSDASRTIGAEATRFITYHGDMNGAIRFKAKNNQGTAISKGQVVYISGVSGTVPEVKLAKADSASTMPAFGLALADANNQAEVQIITFGNLTDYNTTTYSLSANDTVFVSAATAGALVNSAPTGEGNLIQNIGRVVRADASAGIIKVGGAGRSAATPNLNDGNIFIGNASNQSSTTALSGVAVTSFNTATGDLTIGGDDLTADHTAVNYTAANANIDGHFSGVDTKLGTLLADITGESLNDLSDVSFTAGAGIDGHVLTYDNTASEWQAVAPTSSSPFTTTNVTVTTYDASVNEIINLKAATTGEIRVNLPSSASNGDLIILRKSQSASTPDPVGNATKIAVYDSGGTKLKDLEMYPVMGSHILAYDGTDWTFPVTNLSYLRVTGNSTTIYNYRFGQHILYADSADTTDFTAALSAAASTLLEGARQRIICRGERNIVITSTANDIVDPTSSGASPTLTNSVTLAAHSGMIEIWVNSQSQYVISAPLANLGSSAFIDVADLDLSAMDNTTSAFISDITGESLNDLSDVSYTAGAGIDNYVLTYDNGTNSWGAEAPSSSAPNVTSASPSSDYTISTHAGNEEIYVLTPSANISVFLPAASSCGSGYKYHIKNMASGFTLTIDANSTETIDGSTTVDIANQYEALTLITDGSNWFII